MIQYRKKSSQGKKTLVDGDALTVVDIKKEMVHQKNLLYTENTRGLIKRDLRWKQFFEALAGFIGEKITAKVIAKVSTVNQLDGKKRFPNCGMCIFWKLPADAKNKSTGIRACTNPRTFRGVYSFNPHKAESKEEIIEQYERQEFYTHRHQTCTYGSRSLKVKGISEF